MGLTGSVLAMGVVKRRAFVHFSRLTLELVVRRRYRDRSEYCNTDYYVVRVKTQNKSSLPRCQSSIRNYQNSTKDGVIADLLRPDE